MTFIHAEGFVDILQTQM